MKTLEEIKNKLKSILTTPGEDTFGTKYTDLLVLLPYEYAKEFLKDAVTEAEWQGVDGKTEYSEEGIKKEIIAYLPFAWEKANSCRGLSAARSMDHMWAWCWVLEWEDLCESIKGYSLYGKPQLKAISERVGFDWAAYHNGLAGNSESTQTQNDLNA